MSDISPYGRVDCWACEWAGRVQACWAVYCLAAAMVSADEVAGHASMSDDRALDCGTYPIAIARTQCASVLAFL